MEDGIKMGKIDDPFKKSGVESHKKPPKRGIRL